MPTFPPSLEAVFADDAILRIFCKRRASVARFRHDRELQAQILGQAPSIAFTGLDKEILDWFPRRKDWIRAGRERRRGAATVDVTAESLFRTIKKFEAKFAGVFPPNWLYDLHEAIAYVQYRALPEDPLPLSPPRVSPQLKERVDGENHYRPVVQYRAIDSAVEKLIAKYLTVLFDPLLLDCAVAFRARDTPSGIRTHHDAVRQLIRYHERTEMSPKWVAECDIQKFFDFVHHDVARRAFTEAVRRSSAQGLSVDTRAIKVFEDYLRTFNFPETVLADGLADLRRRDPAAEIPWSDRALRKHYDSPHGEKIGVPQGAAISGVIVNLVLDHADRAVMRGHEDEDQLFYMRYCDDIVILHPDESECRAAFERYLTALEDLRLPFHQPMETAAYGREFWKAKSKYPYRWRTPETRSDVPWLSFLGYQIRHDGVVRVRRDSIRRELEKQARVAQAVKRAIEVGAGSKRDGESRELALTRKQILERLRLRMVSMSVGRRKVWSDIGKLATGCWAAGYKLLGEFEIDDRQLRLLDRERERQIGRVRRAVDKALKSGGLSEDRARRKASSKKRRLERRKREGKKSRLPELPEWFGYPFSYFGQFVAKHRRPAEERPAERAEPSSDDGEG